MTSDQRNSIRKVRRVRPEAKAAAPAMHDGGVTLTQNIRQHMLNTQGNGAMQRGM